MSQENKDKAWGGIIVGVIILFLGFFLDNGEMIVGGAIIGSIGVVFAAVQK